MYNHWSRNICGRITLKKGFLYCTTPPVNSNVTSPHLSSRSKHCKQMKKKTLEVLWPMPIRRDREPEELETAAKSLSCLNLLRWRMPWPCRVPIFCQKTTCWWHRDFWRQLPKHGAGEITNGGCSEWVDIKWIIYTDGNGGMVTQGCQ